MRIVRLDHIGLRVLRNQQHHYQRISTIKEEANPTVNNVSRMLSIKTINHDLNAAMKYIDSSNTGNAITKGLFTRDMLEQLLKLLGIISQSYGQTGFNNREMICVLYLHKILSTQSYITYQNLYSFLSAAYKCESIDHGILLAKSYRLIRCACVSKFAQRI